MLRVSTDKSELDLRVIHGFLAGESHWARGIPVEVVQRSIQHSLCFGGFVDGAQVAFARVVTDYATFANLLDVFVLPAHRGRGYSKALMQAIVSHPKLQGLRRFSLATADAHALYAQFGFAAPRYPERMMERLVPNPYERRSLDSSPDVGNR